MTTCQQWKVFRKKHHLLDFMDAWKNRVLENKYEGYIGFCFPGCCRQYKWLKAFGNFDHSGTFQWSVICLHLMSLTLAMMPCTHRNLWTVITTRLTIAAMYHLWWYGEKLFFKTIGKACLRACLIICEKGFVYLLDTISNENNTLTIYFITAKLLVKWFKTNTCVFTTLWAIFLETRTLQPQGMAQIKCIGKFSQLK